MAQRQLLPAHRAALNFPAVTPIRVYPAVERDGAVYIHAEPEST